MVVDNRGTTGFDHERQGVAGFGLSSQFLGGPIFGGPIFGEPPKFGGLQPSTGFQPSSQCFGVLVRVSLPTFFTVKEMVIRFWLEPYA